MKLIVPHLGKPEGRDARLLRLAEFLGITCEPHFLERSVQHPLKYFEEAFRGQDGCLVVSPEIVKQWAGGFPPDDLARYLTSRFRFLLVHGLTPDFFCKALVKALSIGRVQSVQPVADSSRLYEIAADATDLCGPFSGISFGPVNPANDHILSIIDDAALVRTSISIDGQPFMAAMRRDKAEIFFLASTDVMDLNSSVADKPLSEFFSQVVPYVMTLRHMFGDQCWHPSQHSASFVIDDPLLRPQYGYLDFEILLRLMTKYNFATTIAFIPHNYRRNSKSTLQMFRQCSDRLAICFHGNDHTAGEFASTDISQLNTALRVAEARMDIHANATGVSCGRVMVFPQEKFSVEAMKVLRARNFLAAVNAGLNPSGRQTPLTLGELAQPAIFRHGGFPLFHRKYIGQLKRQDIAFNLFFGRPILLVDHHDTFRRAESLIDAVLMINSIAPEIRWRDLASTIMNSTLTRTTSDGVSHVRAYSGTVHIANDRDSRQQFVVEWNHSVGSPPVAKVLQSGTPNLTFQISDSMIHLSLELAPRSSQTLSVAYRNDYPSLNSLGFTWGAKAFIRRRLSEARDNHISKNRYAMVVAQALRRRVLSKIL